MKPEILITGRHPYSAPTVLAYWTELPKSDGALLNVGDALKIEPPEANVGELENVELG